MFTFTVLFTFSWPSYRLKIACNTEHNTFKYLLFSTMEGVDIQVEYCGSCGHKKQYVEMADLIKNKVPNAKISGSAGRQASFEIRLNGELVYSKLQTMAFPNFVEVSDLVAEVQEGKPIRKIEQQQPIDCCIM